MAKKKQKKSGGRPPKTREAVVVGMSQAMEEEIRKLLREEVARIARDYFPPKPIVAFDDFPLPEPPRTPPADQTKSPEERIIDLYNEQIREIYRRVVHKGRTVAYQEGLSELFESSSSLGQLFSLRMFREDGSLLPDLLIANLQKFEVKSQSKLEYLNLALCEIFYFLLFTAMEDLDRETEKELESEVKRILGEERPVVIAGC